VCTSVTLAPAWGAPVGDYEELALLFVMKIKILIKKQVTKKGIEVNM
jgi:hypothetical protein